MSSNFPARIIVLAILVVAPDSFVEGGENWPRWRGPDGNAVSAENNLPREWSQEKNIRWKAEVPGEGSSSPILWENHLFLTSAFDRGEQRVVHCFDPRTGEQLWSRQTTDDNPEISSALTGHAASTPVTNGKVVVAAFGNAGVVCYDFQGNRKWHRDLGDFDTELGMASSPILFDESVILVCDHDGNRFRSFDSFLIALDLQTGKTRWKTERPKLGRSWSTPIVVPAGDRREELIVAAQDELRAYDPLNGRQLWHAKGLTGWVAPSPAFGQGLIFSTSGKNGPTLAVRPGGEGDVTESHIAWQHDRGAPYVCSPLLYLGHLYVHNGQGILTCYRASDGERIYRRRLDGNFTASGVAADGRLYLTNEDGETFVIRAGTEFEILSRNPLEEYVLASPAIAQGCLFLRTERHLYCIAQPNTAENPPSKN